jgi:hypothetical protein
MKPDNTIIDHILNVIALAPRARIEDVAKLTPELTLREVFYTLCYLSRRMAKAASQSRQRCDCSTNHRPFASELGIVLIQ